MEETIESTQEVEQMVSRGTQETIPSLLRKEMLSDQDKDGDAKIRKIYILYKTAIFLS